MTRGAKLVCASSKVGKVNVCKKYHYSKKLEKLNKSVEEFIKLDAQAMNLRDGKETLIEVQRLSQDVKILKYNLEVGNAVPMTTRNGEGYFVDYLVPQAPDVVIGREAGRCFREIQEKLLKDGFSITVVSAPGSCGKTTLVTGFCHDEEIKAKFGRNILFIPLSTTPDLADIVQRMAARERYAVTRIKSKERATDHLQQLLPKMGQKPLVIVLDDVWSSSESIAEKFIVRLLSNYKIVVTSRFEFPGLGNLGLEVQQHRLNPLDRGDSMKLFHRMAVIEGGRSGGPDKQVLEQLVDACKGLPLALTVMGKSLRGEPPAVWERKRDELSEGNTVVSSNSEILNCLKKSLDDLDGDREEAKKCFLDLSSFPEDHKIPADALIDMWTELYNLNSDAHAISNLHKLSRRSLVNLIISGKDAGESDGFYDGHRITVHDLLRDLAIMDCNQDPVEERERLTIQVTGSEFPRWLIKRNRKCFSSRRKQFKARLASITTGPTFSSSWPKLHLPQTEVLLLNFGTSTCSLPNFVRGMGNLKSLLISNRYLHLAKLTNLDHISALSNLKRIRLERIMLPPFNPKNMPLRHLRKLSLFMCNISQALAACETKVSCLLPSLVELNIVYCIDLVKLPAGLCELVHLTKLSITNCHELVELPERIGSLTQLMVLRLSSCTKLAELPESIANLKGLTFLDISDCLKVNRLPDGIGELVNLRKLYLRGCLKLSSMPSSMKNLKSLLKVICDDGKEEFFKSMKRDTSSSRNNLEIVVVKEEISLRWMLD